MKFDIVNIEDKDDGSVILTIDMDRETMLIFAEIGIMKTIIDAANGVVKNEG